MYHNKPFNVARSDAMTLMLIDLFHNPSVDFIAVPKLFRISQGNPRFPKSRIALEKMEFILIFKSL